MSKNSECDVLVSSWSEMMSSGWIVIGQNNTCDACSHEHWPLIGQAIVSTQG